MGCDGKIWSDAEEDKCGVCNGDGTTCETKRGIFTAQVKPHSKFVLNDSQSKAYGFKVSHC